MQGLRGVARVPSPSGDILLGCACQRCHAPLVAAISKQGSLLLNMLVIE